MFSFQDSRMFNAKSMSKVTSIDAKIISDKASNFDIYYSIRLVLDRGWPLIKETFMQ